MSPAGYHLLKLMQPTTLRAGGRHQQARHAARTIRTVAGQRFWTGGKLARKTQRRSRIQRLRQRERPACAAYITNDDGVIKLDHLRRLFGGACKFVLPTSLWDYAGPVKMARGFGTSDLAADAAVKPMIEQFRRQRAHEMELADELTTCMKQLVSYGRGLQNPKCKNRTRKSRLGRLRDDFFGLLRDHDSPSPISEPMRGRIRGTRLFAASIRDQFLLGEHRND